MNILVTGGAGYIGSHTVRQLVNKGHNVVVYDNLSKGHREAVPEGKLVIGDTSDMVKISSVLRENNIDAIIHFAAFSLVGESSNEPSFYYNNNVVNTIKLLDTMIVNGVSKIVFSSTAAVYGEPKEMPITENSPKEPTNVYGNSKLMVEHILESYDKAYGLKYISLRYFNAAGADLIGDIGEDHHPETHLIPIIMQVALGQRESIQIFGDNYDTPDGTCIRDYVHVNDLGDAHILAVESLAKGSLSKIYNLGNGKGFSVKEVIDVASKVTGKAIPTDITQPREGDPAILVASSEKIKQELGWNPKYSSLEEIIASAWKWHSQHPYGYSDRNFKKQLIG